jgi:sugar fermentation stimulation protein A
MTNDARTLFELRHDTVGIFRTRPNRFLGRAAVRREDGGLAEEYVHIHDPGRLRELLHPGNRVLLRRAALSHKRKTAWDLLAASHGSQWVLVHSGYHRGIAEQILKDPTLSPLGSLASLRAEVKRGHSRMDFLGTRVNGGQVLIEVKGCTLVLHGKALFPDAPTERGRRHVATLIEARQAGFEASIIVLIFRSDAERFAPNHGTDPAFADVFGRAVRAGVAVFPLVLAYDGSTVRFLRQIPWDFS